MSKRLREQRRGRLAAEEWRLPPAPGGSPDLLVVYPNAYPVGMANLGFHAVLEGLIRGGAAVDRAFLPDADALEEHGRAGTAARSLDSQRPLADFAALLFSVSFEPDLVGVVQLLELAGLPPLAAERTDEAPLIVIGGMAPSLNPEPSAPFADLIGIGEAEALLPPLLPLLREPLSRADLLGRAAALPGWYAPRHGRSALVRQSAPHAAPCAPVVLAPEAVFGDHFDIEISRGCLWRCRFCAAGHVIAPYREHGLEALDELIAWGVAHRGRVGLVGTDVSDHRRLEAIVEAVWRRGGEVAFPSLRVEPLGRRTSAAGRLLRQRPPHTLTLAVESATTGLRHGLGKRLSGAQVLRAVSAATEAGVHKLRLYFLVGVPGETLEDVEAIAALAGELRRLGPPGGLDLSVNGLVPKPGTPLQWEAAPGRDYLREARQVLRRRLPRGVSLSFESPDWTRWQALLSLSGREVAPFVLAAARQGWRRALAAAEAESPVLRGEGRWPDGELPWAHVNHGQPGEQRVLLEERQRCWRREYVAPARLRR